MEKFDYKIIDGKPHFGLWFGISTIVNHDAFIFNHEIQNVIDKLEFCIKSHYSNNLEIREKTHIVRPPYSHLPICQNGSVAIKFVAYGRAWRVMKLIKKNAIRYKKVLINGQRKWKLCKLYNL